MSRQATSVDEVPIFFPSDGEDLFGVLTRPTVESNGITAILISGAGRKGVGGTPAPGRNRMWVRLARTLAADGFHALRMDFCGVGESSGYLDDYRLEDPRPQDVVAAATWLAEHGLPEVAIIGICFGGRAAMASGPLIDGLAGVAVLGSPLRDFVKAEERATKPIGWHLRKAVKRDTLAGLLDPARRRHYGKAARDKARIVARRFDRRGNGHRPARPTWASGRVIQQLSNLAERRVPVLFGYGEEDEYLDDFRRAQAGPIAHLFAPPSTFEVTITPGQIRGLGTLAIQDEIIRVSQDWLRSVVAKRAAVDHHGVQAIDTAANGGGR